MQGRIGEKQLRRTLKILGVAAVYYLGARLGFALTFGNANVTAVWPPTGIAVASLLLLGPRVWPGVFIGAFLANVTNGLAPQYALGIAVGNTTAPVVATLILDRFDLRSGLDRLRDVLLLLSVGAGAMTISASCGVAVLAVANQIGSQGTLATWLLWFVGDAMGVVLLAPVVLTFAAVGVKENPLFQRPWRALALLTLATTSLFGAMHTNMSVRYLVLPLALLIAVQFEMQGAAVVTALLSGIAVYATATAPTGSSDANLMLLQATNGTLAITLLSLAAIMRERRRAQHALRTAAAELENRVKARTLDLAHANERLRASEERLTQAQELAHIGSFEWDNATKMLSWTDELFRIYGLDPAGDPPDLEECLSFNSPADRERVRASVERMITNGGAFGDEFTIVLRNGTRKWVDAYVEVVRDNDGNFTGLRGTCQDITARRAAEEAHRASEEKFRALLESAPDAMVVVDSRGYIVLLNDEATSLLGYEHDELLGHSIDLLLPTEVGGGDTSDAQRPMGAGRDLFARRKDGAVVPVDINLSSVATDDGEFVFASMRDATERRRVEDALRTALEREREAANHLRELDDTKNAILSAVSHELRTPLTAILGFAELLGSDNVRSDETMFTTLLGRLNASATRLSYLLQDLLDLNRLQSGVIEPQRESRVARELVDEVLADLDLTRHPVSVRVPDEECTVDPMQFERIVENLIGNALKYTPAGTPIDITVSTEPDGGVILHVDDDGPGIPAELRETIFEPFVRAGSGPFTQGAGVGLALVDRFARMHGGRAWVEEGPRGGASFTVSLPGGSGPGGGSHARRTAAA